METGHNAVSARLKQRCLNLSRSLAVLAAVLPLLTAIGWYVDIPVLRSVHPALPAMQPNTALALMLAAIATPFVGDHRRSSRRCSIPAVVGLVISLIGLITLAEYVFSVDLWIDRLFPTDAMAAGLGAGRPSPQTAVNFALLGAGMILHDVRGLPIRLGQACVLAVSANAIVALTGYIFDVSHFYGFPTFESAIGMAVHTAAAFVVLAIALLCSRPDDGMMSLMTSSTRSGTMARQILLTATLAPPLVGTATRIGVLAGWYDVHTQASLFVVVVVGVVLRTTWMTARQSEQAENRAREAFEASETTNVRLQKALDERRIFEALIENSSDFIGIADPDGTPSYLNPAGRRMVGLASDFPVETIAIQDCYPPDERAFVSDVILKSMLEHGRWSGETRFRHWQTEQAIPVSDEHFTIRDRDSGRLLGLGTITRDISDVKRTQEQLRQSQERFELALSGRSGLVGLEHQDGGSRVQCAMGRDARPLPRRSPGTRGLVGVRHPFRGLAAIAADAIRLFRWPRDPLRGRVPRADGVGRLDLGLGSRKDLRPGPGRPADSHGRHRARHHPAKASRERTPIPG